MRTKTIIYLTATLLTGSIQLAAQQVAYSPYFRDYSLSVFQVAGKAGDYYWVEKEKPPAHPSKRPSENRQQFFDVYDSRMNLVQKIAGDVLSDATVKEYLISGTSHFDQLLLLASPRKTRLLLKRYAADGLSVLPTRMIDSLPFSDDGRSFILMRSANRSRLELIAFEPRPGLPVRLHTILFDQDWKILHKTVIDDPNITQPCIQDDFMSFPAEDFDNLPVKLADNGEWLMSSPSRTSTGYLFFHFCEDGSFSHRDIRLPADLTMEDITVTIDKANTGASVGILSGFRLTSIKKLQVTHYSLSEGRFDFDSSYFFNTLAGRLTNSTLVNAGLMGLPGGGYLLLTEYGRPKNGDAPEPEPDVRDAAFVLTGLQNISQPVPPMSQEGFVHKSGLHALQTVFSRGDLSMFYFPSAGGDSCWSGLIHTPQTTELNWPSLSYLVMPAGGRLLFLYNSLIGMTNYASTTVLDRQGNPSDDGLVFWKFSRLLNFQHAHRIAEQEVAIPYVDRPGFAVIRNAQ